MNLFSLAIMAAAAAWIQVSLPFSYLPLDLALMVTVFTGLQRGKGGGFVCGLTAGLLLDALASPRLGPRLVSLSLIGALADSLEPTVNRDQPRLQVLAASALSLGHDLLLLWSGVQLGLSLGGLRRPIFNYILPRLVLHAGLAVPFFFAFRSLVRGRAFKGPEARAVVVIRKLPR